MDDLQRRRATDFLRGVCGVGVHGVQEADVLRLTALLHEVAGEAETKVIASNRLANDREAAEREKRQAAEAEVVELRAALDGIIQRWVRSDNADSRIVINDGIKIARAALSAPNAGERLLNVAKAAKDIIGNGGCIGYQSRDRRNRTIVEVDDVKWMALAAAVRAWEGR